MLLRICLVAFLVGLAVAFPQIPLIPIRGPTSKIHAVLVAGSNNFYNYRHQVSANHPVNLLCCYILQHIANSPWPWLSLSNGPSKSCFPSELLLLSSIKTNMYTWGCGGITLSLPIVKNLLSVSLRRHHVLVIKTYIINFIYDWTSLSE